MRFLRGRKSVSEFGRELLRPRPVLIAVLADFSVQGILGEPLRGKRFKVLRYLEIPLETSVSRARAKLARLMEALDVAAARDVIVVTDEVQMLAADLPQPTRSLFKGRGKDTLREGARWEVAPFLAYPAEKAMVSVLPLERDEEDEEELDEREGLLEGEASRSPCLVFALPRNVYENLERACKAFNLRLLGVMPGESFLFGVESDMDPGQVTLIMDWRVHEVLGAMVRAGRPGGILREPVVAGDDGRAARSRLIEGLRAGREMVIDEIILGGERAEQESGGDTEEEELGNPARLWSTRDDLAFVESPAPLPARYLTGMGAAASLIDPLARSVRIDNRTPLRSRVRSKIHALPLVLIILLLLGMGAEYLYMRHRHQALETSIVALTETRETLEQKVQNEAAQKKRFNRLRQKKSEVEEKIRMLDHTLPARTEHVVELFEGIIEHTPGTAVLRRIEQFSDEVYYIHGSTMEYASISQFVVDLNRLALTRSCRLEKSVGQAAVRTGTDRSRSGPARYDFIVQVRLTE
jgi:Tfp pilus assembly protein PilO